MDAGDDIEEEMTPTDRVRAVVYRHLHGHVGYHVVDSVVQATMEALAEAKPIIAEIIDRERAAKTGS